MKYCDIQLREALRKHLSTRITDDCMIKEEFGIGGGLCRVDVGVFCSTSAHGFEIKSDLDTLSRLEHQIPAYGRFFDTVTLVTGPYHAQEVLQSTPKWCGVMVAGPMRSDEFRWHLERAPKPSPIFDAVETVEIFWREYLVERLTAKLGCAPPRSWNKKRLATRFAEVCTHHEIKQEVFDFMRWKETAPKLNFGR